MLGCRVHWAQLYGLTVSSDLSTVYWVHSRLIRCRVSGGVVLEGWTLVMHVLAIRMVDVMYRGGVVLDLIGYDL